MTLTHALLPRPTAAFWNAAVLKLPHSRRVCAPAHVPPASNALRRTTACPSRGEGALRRSPGAAHLSSCFFLLGFPMLHQNIRVHPYEGQENFPLTGSTSHRSHFTLNSGWRFYHSKYKSLWWVSTQEPLSNKWRPTFIHIASTWESSFFFSILS